VVGRRCSSKPRVPGSSPGRRVPEKTSATHSPGGYPRRFWLALLFVLPPSAVLAQGGEWPTLTGAGIEYLSETGFLQVSLSGQLDLEAMHVGGDGWGGLVKQRSGTETPPTAWLECRLCHVELEYNGRPGNVMAHRLRVFTDIFLGDHVYSLIEVRSDRGHAPANKAVQVRVEQAYVRLTTGDGGAGLQLGRFASPFGSYALRHLTVADPFLRPPLPYEYRTLLVRRHVPGSEGGVASWKDWPVLFRSPGAPPVWDVPYQPGAMVFGRLGPIDLRAAAMSGAPSSDPADWGFDLDRFRKPSWVLGARTKLSPGLDLGASYSRGPWMERPFGGTVPPPAESYRDFDQEIFSADFAWARGPMMFRAEAMLDLWEVPAVQERLRDLSYTAELQWDLRAGLSAAARFGMIDFRPLQAGTASPEDWDRDVYRVEASLGYRLVRNAGVMLSAYQQNVRGADGTYLGGIRLWYAF
jgi:hypothetical protein